MTIDNKTKPVIALSGASGYIGTNLMNKLKKTGSYHCPLPLN